MKTLHGYIRKWEITTIIENYKKALQQWRQGSIASSGMYVAAGYVIRDLVKHNKNNALNFIMHLQNEIPLVSLIQKACVTEDFAYCYDALKSYSLAEKYYLQSVAIFEESGEKF